MIHKSKRGLPLDTIAPRSLLTHSLIACLWKMSMYVSMNHTHSNGLLTYRESQASTSPCTCRKTRPWDPNQLVCQWFHTSRIWSHFWLAPKHPISVNSLNQKIQKERRIWRMNDAYPVLQNPPSTFTTELSMQQTSRSIVRLVDFRLSFSDLERWRWDLGG